MIVEHPFFGPIPPGAASLLFGETRRLLGLALAGDVVLRDEVVALLDDACAEEARAAGGSADASGPAGGLSWVLRDIRRERRLSDTDVVPTTGAAVAAPVADAARQKEADILVGWVLAAALMRRADLRRRGEPIWENRIRAAIVALRLLKTDNPDLLGAFSLDGVTSLDTVLTRLEAFETATLAGGNPRRIRPVTNRIRPLRALVEGVVKESATRRQQRERTTVVRAVRPDGPHRPMVVELVEEEVVEAEVPHRDRALDEPPATQRADTPRDRRYVTRRGDAYDDLDRDRAKTRTAAAVTAVRGLALPAEYHALTAHETRRLIALAMAAPGDAGLQALALSLIFGRRIERLQAAMGVVTDLVIDDGDGDEHTGAVVATDHWTRIDREPVLEIAVRLPDFAIDAEEADGLGLTADGSERLRLRCPRPFSPSRLFAVDQETVKRALAWLRPEAARRWSQGRIAGWLEVWLQRAGADPAVIGALCGHDPGQRAQMHYTAVATDDLLDWWERALREGLGLEPAPRVPSDPRLGSRARLAVELLRDAYGEFASDIAGMTPLANPASREDVATAHNAFATYTLDLLMFATGHRPVRSPFERVTDYDLDHAVLWISDKVVRGGPSSRIVALPPAAVAQLRLWETHLAELARRLRPFDPDAAAADILPALNPSRKDAVRPLFFFLDEEGDRLEATRKELILRRHDVLPVQENVARHVLRTWLVEQRVAPHAIDAVIGHARLGEEPLTKSASLRIADLRLVAGQAQALLDRIGLAPLASPLCAP